MNNAADNNSPHVAALRAAYADLNRGHIATLVSLMDDAIEWSEPSDFPGGGTYRGKDQVERHFTSARARWAEGECRPERISAVGDKVVVCSRVHVRFKGSTEWIDGDVTDVYTFQGGKAVHGRVFADRDEAFRVAGLEPGRPR